MARGAVRGSVDVRFRGLRELDRALGKANRDLRRDLRDKLKDAADLVATEAREIATSKGLRQSGDLVAGIRPFALTGRAGVRSVAQHRGFNYPRRLEFEGRGGNEYGPRATVLPALERKEGEIVDRLEGLLDDIARDFNRGGT